MKEVSYKKGEINAPEVELGKPSAHTNVHVYYDHVPSELQPPKGSARTKWVFLTAIANDQESALDAYKQGKPFGETGNLYFVLLQLWSLTVEIT